MKRMFLVPVLGFAVFGLAAPAHAQLATRDHNRVEYGERQSYYDSRRAAYDNGFREGAKEGEKDARKNDRFAYEDERTFQRADKGYHRQYGDIDRYRQSFRSGYAAGYSESYQRFGRGYNNGRYGNPRDDRYGYPRDDRYGYPRDGRNDTRQGYPGYPGYPGGGGYYSPAFDNGVRDGYEKGAEDARKNRSYDVLRHEWYREGDRRYDRDYGSRDQYKNVYREGFKDGYARGYREGRYR